MTNDVTWNSISTFRRVGNIEGISFLLLLLVAMPLKYVWGWPWAVKVVGWAHGVLFIAFGVSLFGVWRAQRWSWTRLVVFFAAAFFPLGPFLADRWLLRRDTAEGKPSKD